MRILAIENDPDLARSILSGLGEWRMNVYVTNCGIEGISLANRYGYDAITLGPEPVNASSIEVVKNIRRERNRTPIIYISGDTSLEAKLGMFEAGIDDYLSKPFAMGELAIRLHTHARRLDGYITDQIFNANLRMNLISQTFFVESTKIELSKKLALLLQFLLLKQNQVHSRHEIMDHLYNSPEEPESAIVEVFICTLRKRLKKYGWTGRILTIRGQGYMMENPLIT